MREYGTLYTEFWIDSVTHSLSDHAKLLAIYCLSSPHTTSLGCFRVPLSYVAEDLSWSLERVTKALTECSQIGFLVYDTQTSWLYIPKFLKWNVITNPNQWIGVRNLLQKVPKNVCFYPNLAQSILAYGRHLTEQDQKHFESLTKPFSNQEQDQDQEQKQEQEQEQNKNSSLKPAEPKPKKSGRTTVNEHPITEIFDFWKTTFGHQQAKLDKKRMALIKNALILGYSLEQLYEAIKGCSVTPHNLGHNDKGQRYDGLHIIFRDAENIDRFIHNCHSPPIPHQKQGNNFQISSKNRLTHDENFNSKQYAQTPIEDISWFKDP